MTKRALLLEIKPEIITPFSMPLLDLKSTPLMRQTHIGREQVARFKTPPRRVNKLFWDARNNFHDTRDRLQNNGVKRFRARCCHKPTIVPHKVLRTCPAVLSMNSPFDTHPIVVFFLAPRASDLNDRVKQC